MEPANKIEILARGICCKSGKVLLCHKKGAENTFLPGGHVEFMEKVEDGLCREIKEEMGLPASVIRFLGAVEHGFTQEGEQHCEINLIFEVEIDNIETSKDPGSCEDYIEFCWVPLDKLAEFKLEPGVLVEILPSWLGGCDKVARWQSTY